MSALRCCVPQCNVRRGDGDNISLHSFPNPDIEPDWFRNWLYNIGGDILALDNQYIFKNRKVCHKHFSIKYQTWRPNTLSPDAVPTLELPGLIRGALKRPFADVTNRMDINEGTSSQQPLESMPLESTANKSNQETPPHLPAAKKLDCKQEISHSEPTLSKSIDYHDRKISSIIKTEKKKPQMLVRHLASVVKTMQRKKEKLAARLKKAMNWRENITMQRILKKFTTWAVIFTVMQFREIGKDKMGRRFTRDEKIMALSLYKHGPRAYRWLSKIFVLPSPLTLRRLVAKADIKDASP